MTKAERKAARKAARAQASIAAGIIRSEIDLDEATVAAGTPYVASLDPENPANQVVPPFVGGTEDGQDDLSEDYPGQRITGPDFDTRDREGLEPDPADDPNPPAPVTDDRAAKAAARKEKKKAAAAKRKAALAAKKAAAAKAAALTTPEGVGKEVAFYLRRWTRVAAGAKAPALWGSEALLAEAQEWMVERARLAYRLALTEDERVNQTFKYVE